MCLWTELDLNRFAKYSNARRTSRHDICILVLSLFQWSAKGLFCLPMIWSHTHTHTPLYTLTLKSTKFFHTFFLSTVNTPHFRHFAQTNEKIRKLYQKEKSNQTIEAAEHEVSWEYSSYLFASSSEWDPCDYNFIRCCVVRWLSLCSTNISVDRPQNWMLLNAPKINIVLAALFACNTFNSNPAKKKNKEKLLAHRCFHIFWFAFAE